MLRRANSNRLSRRKSTLSIPPKHEHIDPKVARQQAQAAAMYAFARAYERANTEMRGSVEVSQDNNILDQRQEQIQSHESNSGNISIRRQQSVRFTGPEAIIQRRSIGTKAIRATVGDNVAIAPLRPRAITNNVAIPAAYRPPSRSSSIGKASIDKGTAQSIVTALAAYDEYYTREDDIASTPSSYRRMRRSKSTKTLSNPLQAAKPLDEDAIVGNDYNARIWNKVPWIPGQQHQQYLRGPKSMSFLRGGREYLTPAAREDNDISVQRARDNFLHQIEHQRLKEQPSFLFRAKLRREEKPFRQSVRNGSIGSYGNPIGSENHATHSNDDTLRKKARKASWTIKRRLKDLFRRGGDQIRNTKIPLQQIEARTSHRSTDYVPASTPQENESNNVPLPDSVTISRVASRQPSLHSVSSKGQLKSRNGSLRSQRSERSGNSRVTSWTSTVDNTIIGRHSQAEREAQRLSIIQENGTHVSSASFARQEVSNQFSAYPMLHRPQNTQKRGDTRLHPVDSQKVYLALMKRLDENSPVAKLEMHSISSGEEFDPALLIPPRSTSVTSRYSNQTNPTPATIRYVQDDTDVLSDERTNPRGTITPLVHEDDDVFSPKPLLNNNTAISSSDIYNGSNMPRRSISRNPSHTAYQLLGTSERSIVPPQQQAAHNELLIKPAKPPRETRSTFFGTSSLTINRSTSPYRRILAEADYNPTVKSCEKSGDNRILFAPPIIHCSDPKEVVTEGQFRSDKAYTESIYSRTTSGQAPAAESTQSLILIQRDLPKANSNSATLPDGETYQPKRPVSEMGTSPAPVARSLSLREEATIINRSREADRIISINYALPSMPKYFGHFRENAQITDEGTDICQPKVRMDKQPMGILQQKAPQTVSVKPILKRKSSTTLDGFPMPPPPPPPLPPPIPMRSPLRARPSRTSLRSLEGTSTQQTLNAPHSNSKRGLSNGHQLLRPISMTGINRTETPARLIKRIGRPSYGQHEPSPGIGTAVEKQFGSVGSRTPCSGAENCSPADAARLENCGLNISNYRDTKEEDAQVIGSRVMVDLFLSSRRRRVAGSDEGNAFL